MFDFQKNLQRSFYIGWTLAVNDVKGRYRRSLIGPFWLTISMAVLISIIGIVFGSIFQSPMQRFLPFLAVGFIFWAFISGMITESCNALTEASGLIKQISIPPFVFIVRVAIRNLLVMLHHLIIIPPVFIYFGVEINIYIFLFLPGLIFLTLSLIPLLVLCSLVCARYRDVTQIIINLVQVAFYLTPIIWMPELLPERVGNSLLNFNIFFHFMELVRSPLLGDPIDSISWLVILCFTLVSLAMALFLYFKFRFRIAFWV